MSILFAILAVAAGTIGTFIFGLYGLGVTVVLFALAIIFAVKKRKENNGQGGIPSIVVSIIALVFSGIMTLILCSIPDVIKESAAKAGTQYIQDYADDFKFGIFGLVDHAQKSGIDMNILSEEMDKISKSAGQQ